MENVFYFHDINSIGGVESFFYYLSCKYKNMIVYYKRGDIKQIERLAKNIEVRKFENKRIKCKRFFCCYNPDILDYVDAEDYFHLVHCDYKETNFKPITNEKFNHYIGVSQRVCNSFKELTGLNCELIYNPIFINKKSLESIKKYNDNKIHLISATRLSPEKGKERIIKLADLLDKAGIDYEWEIYTNKRIIFQSPNIKLKNEKLNILEEIKKADYLVQLSNHEAFCYSVVESLVIGTPVIITDLPVYKELKIEHGKQAIVCDLDMKNVDIELIKKGLPPFTYEAPKDNWSKYLSGSCDYDANELIKVKVKYSYKDNWLKKQVIRKDIIEIPKWRASVLEATPVRLGIIGLVERL